MPHFPQGVCPISGTGLKSASPSRDTLRARCVPTAHELPLCGPLDLPMSCTPHACQPLGKHTPRGATPPWACASRRRKCARVKARCATPYPNLAESLGVLVNTGLRAGRLELLRAAERQADGAADTLRRGCLGVAYLLRCTCTGVAHICCAADRQLEGAGPLNEPTGTRPGLTGSLCEQHRRSRGAVKCGRMWQNVPLPKK